MIYRVDDSQIQQAWYKYQLTGATKASIPDLCIIYYADHADKHTEIINSSVFVDHGQQLFVNSNPTGLYAETYELEPIGYDANVRAWKQTIKVSSRQPKSVNRPANPLARGVEMIEKGTTFRKIASLIDWGNVPVTNAAGDYMSGFEMEVPIHTFKYGGNFPVIQSWALTYDNCVNSEELTLPIRYRLPDGTWNTVDNIIIPPGQAKLRVTKSPIKPSFENNVQFFAYSWEWQWSTIGWTVPLLNRGFEERVYIDADDRIVTNTADIAAENYERIEKRRITNGEGETVKQPAFLDIYGRKLLVPKLSTDPVGTVDVTKGFNGFNANTLTGTTEWEGQMVLITGNPNGARRWVTTIDFYDTSFGQFRTPENDNAPFTITGANIYAPGINAKHLKPVPFIPLSSVVPVA